MTADLRVDERVFLYPKTRTAPTVCYRQPQAIVLSRPDTNSYVRVLVDGEAEPRRLHVDNVLRNQPAPPATAAPRSHKPKQALPAGMEEAPLW